MARPKPDVELVQVLLRLHPDAIAEIDKRRGDRSRPDWIRTLVTAWLADQMPRMSEAEVGRVMRSISAKVSTLNLGASAVPFGPQKGTLGSRLKKR